MSRIEVIDRLREREAELRGLGVGALYLFGSRARGDAHADSDIDLFFDAAAGMDLSLLDLAGIVDRIGDLLGTKADVHLRACLHRRIRPQAETDALRVF
jgi:predicted nucleotidyltransferase